MGAGFAGVWAAAGAVRTAAELGREEDVTVTVVAPGEHMVIRPRLYEDDPSRMRVALDRVLGPIGVRRVRAEITGVNVDAHRVTGSDHDGNPVELAYDKLVLATGSTLVSPQLPGAEHLFDVDTIEAADALHQHIAQLSQDPQRPGAFTAVVVGGGFTGLEVATELPSRLRAVAGEHPGAGGHAGSRRRRGPRPGRRTAPRDRGRTGGRGRGGPAGHRDGIADGGLRAAHRRHGHRGRDRDLDGGNAPRCSRSRSRASATIWGGSSSMSSCRGRCPHRRLGPRGPAARGGGQAAEAPDQRGLDLPAGR